MASDSEERLVAEIPSSLKLILDEDERTNKEIVIQALETELGVSADDSTAVLERKLRRKETRLQEYKEDLEEQRSRIENQENSVERIRGLLKTKAEKQAMYTDKLDNILDQLEETDLRLPAFTSEIKDAVEEDSRSKQEVEYDLKTRAAKQDRDIYHTQFKEGTRGSGPEPKPIAEVWDEEGGDF